MAGPTTRGRRRFICIQDQTQMLGLLPLATILRVGYLKSPPWQSEPRVTVLRQNTPGQSRTPANNPSQDR